MKSIKAAPLSRSPIGLFDSGVGGLTVLKSLALEFPLESFIYFGDTARLPYGNKSPEIIRKYTEQALDLLSSRGVKASVIACNTASSAFMQPSYNEIPVYNVITPSAELALQISQTKRIGLLATRATVASRAYERAIHQINPEALIFPVACPLFVPLAEEGLAQDPITSLIAYRYISPLLPHNVDTVILGCTHYPLLSEAIQKVVGNSVQLIASGPAVAERLKFDLEGYTRLPASESHRTIEIFCSDLSSHFQDLAQNILAPLKVDLFELV